jgi:hypothetical protein
MLVAPATAGAATTAGPAGCPDVALAQPFSAWGDTGDYFLAPDGGFEADGWGLSGRAAATGANAPYSAGVRSLRLPAGAGATSAPFCIGVEHRALRFFARAATTSSLNVDVLYTDARGNARSLRIGKLAGTARWAPTDIVPMVVNRLAAERGNAMNVQIRLAPQGSGAWEIDDVLIDPYKKG